MLEPHEGVNQLQAMLWRRGNWLQCGFTAAECCQAPGALTLHQGPQGLLEQGAAFLIPAQLLAPGQ
jgi:hypothetical protein